MHIPVLLEEVARGLQIEKNTIIVDGTLGLGGHTKKFADLVGKQGQVIGIELDSENLRKAKENLSEYKNIIFVEDNYRHIHTIIENLGLKEKVQAVLLDIGVASTHFDQADRGFSYSKLGMLDMRFNTKEGISAYDVINTTHEEKLVEIFYRFGEERYSRKIAKNIVEHRKKSIIRQTVELSDIIRQSLPKSKDQTENNKTVRKIFQAIRIEVNHELDNLKEGLAGALSILSPGGRLGVISYHSLEDRIAKQFFRKAATGCSCPKEVPICVCNMTVQATIITKRVIRPSKQEIEKNPRSKSAKLRILQKV